MITIFLVALIIALCSWYLLKWNQLRAKLPPGPKPLPIVGNLLQFDKTDFRKTFYEWHKQYGPMFTVWLGTDPHVFISGYDLMQDLFVKRGELFLNRPVSNSMIFQYATKGNYGIVGANGDMWREQRRFTLQVLRSFGLGRPLMEEKVMTETEKLLEAIKSKLKGDKSKTIDIQHDLELCVGNIISSVLVGRTYPPEDPIFLEIKHLLDQMFYLLSSIRLRVLNNWPALRHIPLFGHFGFDDLKENSDRFAAIITGELKVHKEELQYTATANDFTAAYLQEINRRRGAGEDASNFSEWQLICIMRDLWIAGMETTMTTLRWSLLFMMNNPEVQNKVQKEIYEILGSERLPTMADKPRMPYTMAVLHEVQRCANIVPINIAHTVQEDFPVNGYVIPKDTPVLGQVSIVMMDEKYFPHPEQFKPERFLEDDGKTLKKNDELMPFSLGKRICLGEGLARMELFLIFVSLLQKFKFSISEEGSKPTLNPVLGLTLSPERHNVQITLRH